MYLLFNGIYIILELSFTMQQEDVIDLLKSYLPNYGYRGLDWVTRLKPPIWFKEGGSVVLEDFYTEPSNVGVCHTVMAKSYLDLKENHPELFDERRVYRIAGADPNFFSVSRTNRMAYEAPGTDIMRDKKGNHLFLAITAKQVFEDNIVRRGARIRNALLKGDAIIYDPTLGFVGPLEDSGYIIDKVWSFGKKSVHDESSAHFPKTYPYSYENQIVGKSGNCVLSLGFYFMGESSNLALRVGVGLLMPGFEERNYNLYHPVLDFIAREFAGMDTFLDHMRGICKNSTEDSDPLDYMSYTTLT